MDVRPNDHRRRLLQAMATCVASKGYPAVTIADLAAEARVSKRSFYEQFRDKSECFIALYDEVARDAVKVLQDSFDPARDWQAQIDSVLTAYLVKLSQDPGVLHTLFVDVMSLGAEGLAARRRTTERFADFIVRASQEQIDREQAVAIVAGLHEWVLQAMEQQRVEQLPALAMPGARLIHAVVARGPMARAAEAEPA